MVDSEINAELCAVSVFFYPFLMKDNQDLTEDYRLQISHLLDSGNIGVIDNENRPP